MIAPGVPPCYNPGMRRGLFSSFSVGIFAVLLFAAGPAYANVIWQSTPTHTDDVYLYYPVDNHPQFNGTQDRPEINFGTWTGPDFTTDANTTAHIWVHAADT